MDAMKIICFGDSLTEGWIDDGNSFYPYTTHFQLLLNEKLGPKYEVINCGVSGERIYVDMHCRLPKVLQAHENVELLILQGGTNDILMEQNLLQHSMDLYEELEKLLHIARSYNIPRVCLLTTMEGYFTETSTSNGIGNQLRLDFNAKIKSLVNKCNGLLVCDMAHLLPMFSLDDNRRKEMWDDDLHPSPKGYDRMAEIIFDHIKSFLL